MDLAAIIVAAIALIVAGLSWNESRRSAAAAIEVATIERSRRGDEEAAARRAAEGARHADVRVRWVGGPPDGASELVEVTNRGPCDARNVSITWTDPQPSNHPHVLSPTPPRWGVILSGDTERMYASVSLATPSVIDVELAWEDDSGPKTRPSPLQT